MLALPPFKRANYDSFISEKLKKRLHQYTFCNRYATYRGLYVRFGLVTSLF